MKSDLAADMHGAKKIGRLFHSIPGDFPENTWVFFYFRSYLAVRKKIN